MYSELECGVCYRTYDTGRRCPRELQCKHSFCESCLLLLSRPQGSQEAPVGADRSIVCPLCRQTTTIPAGRKMRAELRVDECILERLLAAGVLHREDEEVEEDSQVQGCCEEDVEAVNGQTVAPGSVSPTDTRGGLLRRSWRKVWRKISGKSSRETDCPTNDDLRSMALMACYMF